MSRLARTCPRGRIRRWIGAMRYRGREAALALWYRLPLAASRRFVRELWESQAEMIHATWGEDPHDFAVIGRLIETNRVTSVLDVGCGSGRLFGLYRSRGVATVVGVDISKRALAIARERYPTVRTVPVPIEELPIEAARFDLAVCNRVLQHVPPSNIRRVIQRLARTAPMVYVNELSASDGERESYYMVRHDYTTLFGREGCRLIEEGRIDVQTFLVFECPHR
jgi:SAM-dependent methyltransferase